MKFVPSEAILFSFKESDPWEGVSLNKGQVYPNDQQEGEEEFQTGWRRLATWNAWLSETQIINTVHRLFRYYYATLHVIPPFKRENINLSCATPIIHGSRPSSLHDSVTRHYVYLVQRIENAFFMFHLLCPSLFSTFFSFFFPFFLLFSFFYLRIVPDSTNDNTTHWDFVPATSTLIWRARQRRAWERQGDLEG